MLLVEDNELNREIAVEILKEAGFEVESAEDGEIAVRKMKQAADGQYDLIRVVPAEGKEEKFPFSVFIFNSLNCK